MPVARDARRPLWQVKKAPTKLSYMYQCTGCDTFTMQPLARLVTKGNSEKIVAGAGPPVDRHCEHCGFIHHVGGAMWTAPMHDEAFVRRLLASLQGQGTLGASLDSRKRLSGMLTSVLEELPDVPLFSQLAHMCSVLCVAPLQPTSQSLTSPKASPSSYPLRTLFVPSSPPSATATPVVLLSMPLIAG